MTAVKTTKLANDANLLKFSIGVLDESGTGGGPFDVIHASVDASGNLINPAQDETVQALDTSLSAINVSLGSTADAAVPGAAGSIIAQLRGLYTRLGGVVLAASSAVIGKVGIDQTTPGTTNAVVVTGSVPLPTGAATSANQTAGNTTLTSILSTLQTARTETVWTDDSGGYYVRVDNGGTITWMSVTGSASAAPGTGSRPAAGPSVITDKTSYQAIAAASGYALGDFLAHYVTVDPATGAEIGSFWINATQSATINAPAAANISPLSPIPSGAATSALQTAGNAALGTTADAAVSGTAGSIIAQLRGLYTRLGAVVVAAGSAIIGKVGIDQTTPGTTNAVFDTQSAPIGGAIALTPGTPAAAGRALAITCSTAGYVSVIFADASTHVFPVNVGYSVLPYAITMVSAGGTTAVASYANLK